MVPTMLTMLNWSSPLGVSHLNVTTLITIEDPLHAVRDNSLNIVDNL
jgi:hypothetical protein